MVSRPYKCPLCHSTFRNESGMNWHLSHRHEIPAAIDALGKEYEERIRNLQEENVTLKKKLEQIERELEQTKMALIREQGKRLEEAAQVAKLDGDLQKAILKIAVRDEIIKQRLGIDMPEPFK